MYFIILLLLLGEVVSMATHRLSAQDEVIRQYAYEIPTYAKTTTIKTDTNVHIKKFKFSGRITVLQTDENILIYDNNNPQIPIDSLPNKNYADFALYPNPDKLVLISENFSKFNFIDLQTRDEQTFSLFPPDQTLAIATEPCKHRQLCMFHKDALKVIDVNTATQISWIGLPRDYNDKILHVGEKKDEYFIADKNGYIYRFTMNLGDEKPLGMMYSLKDHKINRSAVVSLATNNDFLFATYEDAMLGIWNIATGMFIGTFQLANKENLTISAVKNDRVLLEYSAKGNAQRYYRGFDSSLMKFNNEIHFTDQTVPDLPVSNKKTFLIGKHGAVFLFDLASFKSLPVIRKLKKLPLHMDSALMDDRDFPVIGLLESSNKLKLFGPLTPYELAKIVQHYGTSQQFSNEKDRLAYNERSLKDPEFFKIYKKIWKQFTSN